MALDRTKSQIIKLSSFFIVRCHWLGLQLYTDVEMFEISTRIPTLDIYENLINLRFFVFFICQDIRYMPRFYYFYDRVEDYNLGWTVLLCFFHVDNNYCWNWFTCSLAIHFLFHTCMWDRYGIINFTIRKEFDL